jgi:tetratricopeptide (TPR) repeat protein
MTVELPARPVRFVDRDEERARADRAVRDSEAGGRSVTLGLSGPVGVGKSELAYEIGRTLHEERGFPHVLCVDLDDFRVGGALDVGNVLTQLLESLEVEPQSVKGPFGARRRQYRVATSQSRVVLVLDNARYGSEVADLLPASGGVAIVTSRRPLYDLDGGAGVDVPVEPLDDASAKQLLEAIVADGRLAADPAAVAALLELCEGSPLALRVAACTVRSHGLRPLARLLDEVRAVLDEKIVPAAELVLDVAYGELSVRAALLYRLLADYPGPTFTRASATALLGAGADAGDAALEELDRAGLVNVREASQDVHARLRLSQTQRAHGRGRARQDAADDELARAHERFLRWFVRQQQRTDRFLAGERLIVAELVGPVQDAPDVPLADPEDAATDEERITRLRQVARWQYAEQHTLFAAVPLAYGRGLDALGVALCEPAWTYALDHPPRADRIEVFQLGVECAVRAGDVRGIVRMRCQLARWLWESGSTDRAAAELDAAAAAVGLLGEEELDTKLRASVLEFRGMLDSVLGDWTSAAVRFEESRALHLSIENEYGALLQTYRLGQARVELGDPGSAERLLVEAHGSAVGLKRERMAARIGFALGHVLRDGGRTEEARSLYQQSLESARRRCSGFDEARVRDALARTAELEGKPEEAGQHRVAAAEIRLRSGLD